MTGYRHTKTYRLLYGESKLFGFLQKLPYASHEIIISISRLERDIARVFTFGSRRICLKIDAKVGDRPGSLKTTFAEREDVEGSLRKMVAAYDAM